jgi:hypothetical protein
MENTAYFRGLLDRSIFWEHVNGCPTLLIDSEPAMVVVKNSVGRLVIYLHWKSRLMLTDRRTHEY